MVNLIKDEVQFMSFYINRITNGLLNNKKNFLEYNFLHNTEIYSMMSRVNKRNHFSRKEIAFSPSEIFHNTIPMARLYDKKLKEFHILFFFRLKKFTEPNMDVNNNYSWQFNYVGMEKLKSFGSWVLTWGFQCIKFLFNIL